MPNDTSMLVKLSRMDNHTAKMMGSDTVGICKAFGFAPRLENEAQTREEANIFGYRAEFAVARLLELDPPALNYLSDGGVDLWMDDIPIDVKFTNQEYGPLIFDTIQKFRSRLAVLVGRTEHQDVMRINGWILRKDFRENCKRRDFGYGERLYMEHDELNPIETLWRYRMEQRLNPDGDT